jgi:hypothetical protein
MDFPLSLKLSNPTPWEAFATKPSDVSTKQLTEATELAQEVEPELKRSVIAEQEAYAELRLLSSTRDYVASKYQDVQENFQKAETIALDEFLNNITACDFAALAGQLQPRSYQLTFLDNARQRLEARIRAARPRASSGTSRLTCASSSVTVCQPGLNEYRFA